MKDNIIEKLLKPKKAFLIIAIVSIMISLVFYGIIIYVEKTTEKPEAVDYGNLISMKSDNENDYVKTTIQYIALFAEREGYDSKYYYIQDINNRVMIASISDETYKKIEETYLQNKENFTYDLEGYIFNIPDDVLNIAIRYISEAFDVQGGVITKNNYQEYFGYTYLNEGITPNTELNGFLLGGGIFLDGIAIVFLALYITSIAKIYMYSKKFDMESVKSELQQNTTLKFEKERIYLTTNYIVSVVNGLLRITKYQDLVWLYNKVAKQNSVTVNIFLVGATKGKKEFYIANSLKEDTLNNIIYLIKERNENILIGYTPENKKKYEELRKDSQLL